jgi:hypothetical protein
MKFKEWLNEQKLYEDVGRNTKIQVKHILNSLKNASRKEAKEVIERIIKFNPGMTKDQINYLWQEFNKKFK